MRELTGAEKLALASVLSMQEKRRWMAALRQEFPYVSKQEFRQIVIRKLLEESEEEARIARGEYRNRRNAQTPQHLTAVESAPPPIR
jgi:hypothetical protein